MKGKTIKWDALALVLPFALTGMSALFLTIFFDSYLIKWNGSIPFYLLNFIAVLIGCFGEEIGWRGYLNLVLMKKHSPFISSFIIGCLWGVAAFGVVLADKGRMFAKPYSSSHTDDE